MTNVMRKSYAEVDEILKYLPSQYGEKVPLKLRKLFQRCRREDDNIVIDPNKSLHQQNVVYETRVILVILKMNYWCESQEEKERIKKQLMENDQKLQDKFDTSKIWRKE